MKLIWSILFSVLITSTVQAADSVDFFCEYEEFRLRKSVFIGETEVIMDDMILPQGILLPCNETHPMAPNHNVVHSNDGIRYFRNSQKGFIRTIDFNQGEAQLKLKGPKGRINYIYNQPGVSDETEFGVAMVNELDRFQLLDAFIFYDYTTPLLPKNQNKIFYKVRVLPGSLYSAKAEGWILADNLEVVNEYFNPEVLEKPVKPKKQLRPIPLPEISLPDLEIELPEPEPMAPKQKPLPLPLPDPAPQPIQLHTKDIPIDQTQKLRPSMGKCIQALPLEALKESKGKIIRRHLWDQRWAQQKPLKFNGQKLSNKKLYAIDALARTLYGEVGSRACTREGTHYIKSIAKTILNRSAYVSHWGPVPPFYRQEHGEGFNSKGKPKYLVVPYVLESNAQYSPWNIRKEDKGLLSKMLCIQPNNTEEDYIWEMMVNIATNAILNNSVEDATEEITQYFFTHHKVGSPWGPTYTLAQDPVQVDGQPVDTPECLQRWNSKNYTAL